jgi:hypothetical protein
MYSTYSNNMKTITASFLLLTSTICFGQVDLLNTDFQTGIPGSYSIVDNDGLIPDSQVAEFTSAWIIVQDPDNISDTVAASTSFFTPVGTANRWMITPALVLGSFGNFIQWEAKSQDASYPDDYIVMVSTTDNQLSSFTDTIGSIIEENFEWTNRQVDLSSKGYNNQTIYIAFVNVTENGFKLYIDDIHAWKEDPASVKEITQFIDVTIYPNPTSGLISIDTEENIINIAVLSSSGRTLSNSKVKNLDLSEYSAGVYFITIQTDKGFVTKKILKN